MEDLNNEKIIKNTGKDMEWKRAHENILSDWGDKAMCYRWMHSNANSKYNRLNAMYTIPVIVISTLTGTANFAQEQFGPYKSLAVVLIGSFNILAGIIQTIQQFLKISELNEAHRASSISWDKFYRNIKVELAKAPKERTPVEHMLKNCKEEFDRLMETSPRIPDQIILKFNNLKNIDKKNLEYIEKFNNISKPEICGNLESTRNFRYVDRLDIVIEDDTDLTEHKGKIKLINKFITDFIELKKRAPYLDELMINIHDTLPDMSESELKQILEDYIKSNHETKSDKEEKDEKEEEEGKEGKEGEL